jgi:hypothetical protein
MKRAIFSLILAGLILAGSAGCSSGSHSSAAAHSAASGSSGDRQVSNLPLSAPGPFAVYSGKKKDTLEARANGACVVSLPYAMLTGFPAVDP